MKKKLKERRGDGSIMAVVLVIALMLVSCAIYEYSRLLIIAGGVRDTLQSSILSVATTNYDELYNGLREGYSGGYTLYGERWDEALDVGDIYAHLDGTLGLQREGGYHVSYAGDRLEYRIWGLNVDIVNTPFAPSSVGTGTDQFLATATIELEVPLSFAWSHLPPMRITMRVEAGYTPKF